METKRTLSYSIETNDGNVNRELQYYDYSKNKNCEENMLLYKNINKNNEIIESFNKLYKFNNHIDEMVGNSFNKGMWKINKYENSLLKKQYEDDYNNFNPNINFDIIQNLESSKLIKDKMN
jgi:hypothetical protein